MIDFLISLNMWVTILYLVSIVLITIVCSINVWKNNLDSLLLMIFFAVCPIVNLIALIVIIIVLYDEYFSHSIYKLRKRFTD